MEQAAIRKMEKWWSQWSRKYLYFILGYGVKEIVEIIAIKKIV